MPSSTAMKLLLRLYKLQLVHQIYKEQLFQSESTSEKQLKSGLFGSVGLLSPQLLLHSVLMEVQSVEMHSLAHLTMTLAAIYIKIHICSMVSPLFQSMEPTHWLIAVKFQIASNYHWVLQETLTHLDWSILLLVIHQANFALLVVLTTKLMEILVWAHVLWELLLILIKMEVLPVWELLSQLHPQFQPLLLQAQ